MNNGVFFEFWPGLPGEPCRVALQHESADGVPQCPEETQS